ncbi:hypothetical protein D1007_23066 [Hordeum vulgare]|nr:hypothetical protein D1007_23066 [Hordeum vulgare]
MDPAEGRRILVAVDEGDESVQALRWCLANFATRGDGELAPPDTILLLYVRPTPPTYSVLDASGDGCDRRVQPGGGGRRGDKAQKLCALHNKENGEVKVKVDVKVAVGDARSVICDMVDKLGADVLVMGSHGYGFFKRALLGSVSDYCVSNANCPVLIVKSK